MKRSRATGFFVASSAAIIWGLLPAIATAADLYWNGTGTHWHFSVNWSASSDAPTPNPATYPRESDVAHFNISTVNTPQTINVATAFALGLVFKSTGPVVLQPGAISNGIFIGKSGIMVESGAGPVTINLGGIAVGDTRVQSSQSWINNSANPLTINGVIDGYFQNSLIIDGTGDVAMGGPYIFCRQITKNGTGTLTLGGAQDNIGLGLIANAGTVVLAKASSGFPNHVHAIGGPTGLIINGAMVQLAGTGGDQIYDFSPVSVTSGTLDLNGTDERVQSLSLAGSGHGGIGALVNNAPGTTASLGPAFASPVNLTANATIGGSGDITLRSLISGGFRLTKAGTGTLTLTRPNAYSGGTTVSNGILSVGSDAALGAAASNVDVESAGQLQFTDNAITARTFNLVGGSLEIAVGRILQLEGGQVVNNGEVIGVVNVNNGSLATGTGHYDVVHVNGGGTFAPGNSTGVVTANSVSFDTSSTNGGASLVVELAGTTPPEHDQLRVTGALSLGGRLTISLLNGFTPARGDSFHILEFSTLTGTFSSLHLPELPSGLAWDVSQLYTSGVIAVAVPEPTSVMLFLLAGALLAARSHRQR